MNNTNITYPIYIDPSVEEIETGPNYGGIFYYSNRNVFAYPGWGLQSIGNMYDEDDDIIGRAWVIFDLSEIDGFVDSLNIYYTLEQVVDEEDDNFNGRCDNGDPTLQFYELYKEDLVYQNNLIDLRFVNPNQATMEIVWSAIGDNVFYFGRDHNTNEEYEGEEDDWFSGGLGNNGRSRAQDLINGDITYNNNQINEFMIGLKLHPDDENINDNCFIDVGEDDHLPYLEISYTPLCTSNANCT